MNLEWLSRAGIHGSLFRSLLCVSSGIALSTAQSPQVHGILAIFALAPWILAVRAAQVVSQAVVLSAVFTLSFGLGVASWIPRGWNGLGMGTGDGMFVMMVCLIWAPLPIFISVGFLIWITRSTRSLVSIAAPGLGLGLTERLSSSWEMGIPWAHVGHTQIDISGVAQLALIGGVPLLSVFIFSLNAAIALSVESWGMPGMRNAASLMVAWTSLAVFGLHAVSLAAPPKEHARPIRVLLAQPNLPRAERWSDELQLLNVERAVSVVDRAIAERGRTFDIAVFPENLVTSRIDENDSLEDNLASEVRRIGVPFILGAVRSPSVQGDPYYRSSVVWLSPTDGLISSVDKERAVPIVEGRPITSIQRLLGSALGIEPEAPRVEVVAGAADLRGDFSLTPLLCWEALFADLVDRRRGPESRFLLNLADDSWVAGDVATRQLTDFVRFRAIEQRLPLIRVAHGGLSVVVDRYGRITQRLPLDQYAFAVAEMRDVRSSLEAEVAVLILLPVLSGAGVWWLWPLWVRRFISKSVNQS